MINLEEHKIFIESLNMDVVPLSIAEQAIEERFSKTEHKLDKALDLFQKSVFTLNSDAEKLDKEQND